MTTFYIQQFGCRATQADGAALERQLLDRGCTPASDPASASIVVLNTCTVTSAADAQARDAIRKIHSQNPAVQLIVTGCYAQRAPEELAALPGVSWVVGNSHKPQIPNLVTQITPSAPTSPTHFVGGQHVAPHLGTISNPAPAPHPAQILSGDIFAHPEFLSAPIHGRESHHTRPILKIQDGCNNRCSFCVIPYVRGKSRSLPPDAVIAEIQLLTSPHPPTLGQTFLSVSSSTSPYREIPVAQALLPVHSLSPQPSPSALLTSAPKVGQPILAISSSISSNSSIAREIVLSGINLGTYGRDLSSRSELLDLLRRILDETNLERLRLSSIEPQDVTQDLIDLFAQTDRIAQHFHMPLQSASDPILAAMHRWYRSEHYARRLDLIHDRLPHAAIGADVIAGFPGEIESDHAATLNFIDRHPFTYLHVFSYSPRPGTKAAQSPNQVPTHVIKRRARELRSLGEAKSAAFRHSQIGRTLRVLTLNRRESPEAVHTLTQLAATSSSTEYTPALSSNYLRVQIPGVLNANLWLDVVVTTEEGNYLIAEPVSPRNEFSVNSVYSESSV